MRKFNFDYYYGLQAEQYSFYRIPKALFTNNSFKGMSCEAKLLYGLMLDRMGLSIKNQWLDDADRVYIIFSIREIGEYIGCSNKTAVKLMSELTEIGLIERKRLGFGKSNIIYVKNFCLAKTADTGAEDKQPELPKEVMADDKTDGLPEGITDDPDYEESPEESRSEESTFQEVKNLHFLPDSPAMQRSVKSTLQEVKDLPFKKCKKYTSRSEESTLLEVKNLHPNNTYFNNTYNSDIKSYLSIHPTSDLTVPNEMEEDSKRWMDVMEVYRELIYRNIEYAALCKQYPQHDVDELVELMLEVLISPNPYFRIGGNLMPARLVRSRFMKLGFMHLQYVFQSLDQNTTAVKNVKQYLLTVLYNAPLTMHHYYQAAVQHDLYGAMQEENATSSGQADPEQTGLKIDVEKGEQDG